MNKMKTHLIRVTSGFVVMLIILSVIFMITEININQSKEIEFFDYLFIFISSYILGYVTEITMNGQVKELLIKAKKGLNGR